MQKHNQAWVEGQREKVEKLLALGKVEQVETIAEELQEAGYSDEASYVYQMLKEAVESDFDEAKDDGIKKSYGI